MDGLGVSDWIAAASAVVAVGSLVAALVANLRAKDAVRLQQRIDEREREFRQVSWRSAWRGDIAPDESVVFRLENTGLTDARGVTLVVNMQGGQQAFRLGDIAAGGAAEARPQTSLVGPVAAAALALWGNGVGFGVHWSSPLGQVDSFESETPTAPPRPGEAFEFS